MAVRAHVLPSDRFVLDVVQLSSFDWNIHSDGWTIGWWKESWNNGSSDLCSCYDLFDQFHCKCLAVKKILWRGNYYVSKQFECHNLISRHSSIVILSKCFNVLWTFECSKFWTWLNVTLRNFKHRHIFFSIFTNSSYDSKLQREILLKFWRIGNYWELSLRKCCGTDKLIVFANVR